MTIEEYLNKRIEDTEKNCREKHLDSYDNGYWDGYYDALDDLLRELPLFEHEVTVREVHEMCLEHDCNCISRGKECCLRDDSYCMVNDVSPNNIDVDEIEKRMREARND